MAIGKQRQEHLGCTTQKGRVVSSDGGVVRVSFISQSACSGCHAQGSCGMHEQQERFVDVLCDSSLYRVGDIVEVGIRKNMGMRAVVLSYIFPFFMVVVSIFVLTSFGIDEGLSALVGLSSLVPYFLLLYALRRKISGRFSFSITRKE